MSAPDPAAATAITTETRRQSRTRVFWRVLIMRENGEHLACHTWDLSEDGMCFSSTHAFPTGTKLRLALYVPLYRANKPVQICELNVRTVYQVLKSDQIHTGVSFIAPSPAAQEWIRTGLRLAR